ncbi:Type IV secretory pathway, protease TraF [Brevundimonas diminuta 3F5N]|uniref:Type IV secretory pathway, protease TraF n=1 Tax=Brevundimonas diminuta 3F5N TaxID=1255603 RepID=A0A1R4EQF6_BREDI|nr:S26 family signal peptidase [Brevundimonas diminuta]SJM45924.1 Type IV secretory pathway, protease TraF [Brevundimonas diminuta 3F5N]
MTPLHISRLWTISVAGVALAAVVVIGFDGPAPVLLNESPSLPRGLYLRSGATVERGAVVAIAQPAEARLYLTRLGMPSDLLLLKRVAAVGGDPVCAGLGTVRTPGRQVWAFDRDRQGAALPAWRECRVMASDELFLLGDTPESFDSRYFGPVQRGEAEGVYREVLTW